MANVLLGVTGSVAAIRTPELYAALKKAGHTVRVVATRSSLYFFEVGSLDPVDPLVSVRNPAVVVLDEDEWPGQEYGRRYHRDDPVLHIELRRWADVLVIAPLDANTLAKLAGGFADNCLTCVWRAWDPARPAILAPAMNTFMWDQPVTARHLRLIGESAGPAKPPADLHRDGLIDWINAHCPKLLVVPPQSKRLACGDVGMGALAELDAIVAAVAASLV